VSAPGQRRARRLRTLTLVGLVGGLAAAPLTGLDPPPRHAAALGAVALAAVLAAAARRHRHEAVLLTGAAVCAVATGLALGAARTAAIDGQAYRAPEGRTVEARGFVAAVPRRSNGDVRVLLQTKDGRVLAVASEPVAQLAPGEEAVATGPVREPQPWERAHLAREGVARVIEARGIIPTGARRGGLSGAIDGLRRRAEEALGRGAAAPEAALLRGFVLGQDDLIDAVTVEEFQRSGLAHLLAVSGQNVLLLALLASALLGLAGVPLRARLVCVLALIAVYVPMAGAGPSIQRAGIMGAAGLAAALASRPASRWHAMGLAAALTLALNPRAAGDVGWQLSFAAVAGIALWAAPLRAALAGPGPRRRARAALAEGAALTLAATVATAPLMAAHFERLSLAALPANLVALPAVAPVMWLGMLAAAVGQVPALPAEPISGLAGLFAAFIAQAASWLSAPGWAQVELASPGIPGLIAIYGVLLLGARVLAAGGRARRALGVRRSAVALAGASLLVGGLAAASAIPREPDPSRSPGLQVSVLDVGQGDAILLRPARGAPVLVDAGPPGAGVADLLVDRGVDELAAVVITHDQVDHSGGLAEVLARIRVGMVAHGVPAGRLTRTADAYGARLAVLETGDSLASGPLRLDVLWPPPGMPSSHGAADPNASSVVMVARWRHFDLLLTGDGEAEAVPLDPGGVDAVKLAHHGSEDAGLDGLIERATPGLAVASVGAGNPFGHPARGTLATLAEHEVPLLRTDAHGEITIDVTARGWTASGGVGSRP